MSALQATPAASALLAGMDGVSKTRFCWSRTVRQEVNHRDEASCVPSWRVLKREVELAVYDFIKARIAHNGDQMARLFAKKWDREGGIAGTLGRLVEQAKRAPPAEVRITPLDEQIVDEMMRPMFEGR